VPKWLFFVSTSVLVAGCQPWLRQQLPGSVDSVDLNQLSAFFLAQDGTGIWLLFSSLIHSYSQYCQDPESNKEASANVRCLVHVLQKQLMCHVQSCNNECHYGVCLNTEKAESQYKLFAKMQKPSAKSDMQELGSSPATPK